MDTPLDSRRCLLVFLVFAGGYLLSSTVRGVTATLAPVLTQELGLTGAQLGLLGGAYFLGFAVLQLPLGAWLDRFGPRRVLLVCLSGAVASCLVFAMAHGFGLLLVARWIGGMGVSACLIAPLTGARLWMQGKNQQSANSWMLMAGSLGLLMATLPVQWLLSAAGWRAIFLGMGVLFALIMIGTAKWVPKNPLAAASSPRSLVESYRPIFANAYFQRIAGLGLINYGILVALQTLWAGPWLTEVTGVSANEAAQGLFAINLTMLLVFWGWAIANPRLHAANLSAERLLKWGVPLSVAALGVFAWLGPRAGWGMFATYCTLGSVLSLTHPAVGAAFPAALAGRAISAFNLLLFLGVFIAQWGIGAGIDLLRAANWSVQHAYQMVFSVLAVCCAIGYAFFVLRFSKNEPPRRVIGERQHKQEPE